MNYAIEAIKGRLSGTIRRGGIVIFDPILINETREVFLTHLDRLLRSDFPTLEVHIVRDGEARRYEINQCGTPISPAATEADPNPRGETKSTPTLMSEIDILPTGQTLRIHISLLDEAGVPFCKALIGMLEKNWKVNVAFQWLALGALHKALLTAAHLQAKNPGELEARDQILRILHQRLPDFVGGKMPEAVDLSAQPWLQIEDHDCDREIVRLMCQGLTDRQIGERINKSTKRISNILNELRKKYPDLDLKRKTSKGTT